MRFWSFCALALIGARHVTAMEKMPNTSSRNVDVYPGFKISLYDEELRIKLDVNDIFPVSTASGRTHGANEEEKKPSGLQKFGSMIVMIPLLLQMLSIPGAIASIKMSLLKSLVVGKIALLIMLFNFVRNQQQQEVVVVHQSSPPQHYYYPHIHEDYEDNDKGWFG